MIQYNKLKIFFIIFLIISSSALAEISNVQKIAIIDRDQIVTEALIFKHLRTQIDDQRIKLQKKFLVKEDSLRTIEKNLESSKGLLSPEAFELEVKQFNQKVMEVQRDVSLQRSELENVYMNNMEVIYNTIKDIANRLAKEENIDLILFLFKKNQVFFANEKIDLSYKVLSILDKEFPSIEIAKVSKNK